MLTHWHRLFLLLAGVVTFGNISLATDPEDPATLFSENASLLVEIPRPADLVARLVNHPLVAHLQDHPLVKQFRTSPQYARMQAPRVMVETQLSMSADEAVAAVLHKYVGLAVNDQREITLIVRGRDADLMEKVRASFLELTRLAGPPPDGQLEYKGIAVYQAGPARAAVVRDWLIITSAAQQLQQIIQTLLSDQAAAVAQPQRSLDDSLQYCRATLGDAADVRLMLNLAAIRQLPRVERALQGQASNPLIELLFGGLQTVLQQADWLGAEFTFTDRSATLQVQLPFDVSRIPAARQWYFGADSAGAAPLLPQLPETIVSAAFYRGASQMWLYAGDLFSERTNDQIASAETVLGTLFGGRDFGEEILGLLGPEIRLTVVRQNPDQMQPRPAVLFPAFALVAPLRDPDTMWPELRRTFQSLAGFVNITGAQEGRPQLDFSIEEIPSGNLLTSHFVPPAESSVTDVVPVLYNFSPSVTVANGQLILSSSRVLAERLAAALTAAPQTPAAHTAIQLSASSLQSVLLDNQSQITANSMLDKGLTAAEAEGEFRTLMQLADLVDGLSLQISSAAGEPTLQAALNLELADTTALPPQESQP